MNSYPSEFLAQLGPVMFIAGLDVPPAPPQSDTETSEDDRVLAKSLQADPFISLTERLRDVLSEKSIKKGTVWVGDWERNSGGFRTILVDKNVRFPPQKAGGQNAHSPLSPLTQTSPLYPDGLIAPIWVRKHTELLPAVFVLFLRLYEPATRMSASQMPSPLHHQFVDEEEEEVRREEERRKDTEMSAEIAARKRACGERGVKLTVVLLASRRMLDNPTLDSRLTYIRRQSGLDSRAALFVLSPVTSSELQDFVKSLQSALHDAALEYYLNHSKRVRRKRTRHSTNVNSGSHSSYGRVGVHGVNSSAAGYSPRTPALPLRAQGWLVRYEYKMACFAEFRGEAEVARKHYQTCWEMLLDMFGSTALLPPRTKRWAEAKVLADCVSVKIIKLYLHRAEHSRALAHFNAHLTRFADFSRGWGIGEETWEFWSWIARWYRILAELLDMATLSTLTIPSYLPNFPLRPPTPPASYQQAPQHPSPELSRPFGVNARNALQHPGFYYYAAAMCTERRLERFNIANGEAGADNLPLNLLNERKVDHRVIILELYTKAYESFKKYSSEGRNRLTLHIASRIAQTYLESGKFDVAVRFFERIAKTYRRERWYSMLIPILSMWYASTKRLGDVDSGVRLLLEMMGCGLPSDFEAGQIEEDLSALLKSTSPSTTPFLIDIPDSLPIFDLSVVFWSANVAISEPAAFQLHIKAPTWATLAVLPFVALRLEFLDNRPAITVKHDSSSTQTKPPSLQLIDLGVIPAQSAEIKSDDIRASIRWAVGGTLILNGVLASDTPTTLGISRVVLDVMEGHWHIKLTYDLVVSKVLRPFNPQWLCRLDPPTYLPMTRINASTTVVRHKRHLVDASFAHLSPAYLDEEYPIVISISNTDDHHINVVVDVLLQPVDDETVNHISLGTERSTGLIKGVQYGVLAPGETVYRTLLLHSVGAPGSRTIDISIQCERPESTRHTSSLDTEPNTLETSQLTADVSESLHTLVIPVVAAFETESVATYRRLAEPPIINLADLRSYDPTSLDACAEAIVRTTILARGPCELLVDTLTFIPVDSVRTTMSSTTLDDVQDDIPWKCKEGDVYSVASRFMICTGMASMDGPLPSPGEYQIKWSRAGASEIHLTTTHIPIPALSPPTDNVDALLDIPATGRLHEPLTATLTVRNKHPWRTADLHLQLEPSDHFVVSGLRNGSLPIMLAGSEEQITFNLIPTYLGNIQLPKFKLLDRRKASTKQEGTEAGDLGEELEVLDARLEERDANGDEVRLMVLLREGGDTKLQRLDGEGLSMLIISS